MDTDQYLASWERFWSSLAGTPEEAFWDCDPVHAAQEDLARFGAHMDPRLPLLDVGCGNGTQTRFLAQHFTRVIGTEISPTALEQAKAAGVPANLSYRLLDLLRPGDAQTLHAELGDSNVYLRTLDTGETYIRTTNTLPTGEVIRVPSCYALLQNAQATH